MACRPSTVPATMATESPQPLPPLPGAAGSAALSVLPAASAVDAAAASADAVVFAACDGERRLRAVQISVKTHLEPEMFDDSERRHGLCQDSMEQGPGAKAP
ncbi:hypothetical protein TRIP_B250410 [uncultured Desulfatiglans sp.]|nr:hypothetical protein TRIP_B250410 [uncultured Desulfatiglans sp.]